MCEQKAHTDNTTSINIDQSEHLHQHQDSTKNMMISGHLRWRSLCRNLVYLTSIFCCVTLVRLGFGVPTKKVDDYEALGNNLQHMQQDYYDQLIDGPFADDAQSIDITVKTTRDFHQSRLQLIIDTWYTLAPNDIWFFTDDVDASIQQQTNNHLIVTNCGAGHLRWWCHFDDDNYVNVPALRRLLANFDPSRDYYIGRPSTELPLRVDATAHQSQDTWPVTRAAFWFATGGAGICVSRSLLTKLAAAYIRNERFANIGTHIRLPDDVTLGYIIGILANKSITVTDKFHSHFESLNIIDAHRLSDTVTFSYGSTSSKANLNNTINVDDRYFSRQSDPTRFRSAHCFLFPNSPSCRRLISPTTIP